CSISFLWARHACCGVVSNGCCDVSALRGAVFKPSTRRRWRRLPRFLVRLPVSPSGHECISWHCLWLGPGRGVLFEPRSGGPPYESALSARSWKLLSLPNRAVEVLVHARRHSLVVLIGNVFAYHLRILEAITANAAMPLVAGEGVRTPFGAFRVVFGIGHFDDQINFEAPAIRPTLADCG